MPRKNEHSLQSNSKLHLRYVRLPDRVLNFYDDLVYKSRRVVIGKSHVKSAHEVEFDGEVVLANGFQFLYFDLMDKWFTVGKIRDLQGKHTGYYCDIVTPPKLLGDGGVEITDLFLDVWVSPDLRYRVLDEEELEEAFEKSWLNEQLYRKAKKELKKLVSLVRNGSFPPRIVKRLETKLRL